MPNDQTVLSNEHVVDGRCWRCGAVVETRNMEQWFFRIKNYADALLEDLETIDWPERTKKIQRQHIGRSEGAQVLFQVDGEDVPVFTTRPDTLSAPPSSCSRPSRRSSSSWRPATTRC